MIEKIKVRRRLALYEKKIKEERVSIEEKIKRMKEACTTRETMMILLDSKEYARLVSRLETLDEVQSNILDIRCEEMLADEF